MAMNCGEGMQRAMLSVYPEYGPYLALVKDGVPYDEAFAVSRALVEHWREQDEAEAGQ